jgi:hypothetical protein
VPVLLAWLIRAPEFCIVTPVLLVSTIKTLPVAAEVPVLAVRVEALVVIGCPDVPMLPAPDEMIRVGALINPPAVLVILPVVPAARLNVPPAELVPFRLVVSVPTVSERNTFVVPTAFNWTVPVAPEL